MDKDALMEFRRKWLESAREVADAAVVRAEAIGEIRRYGIGDTPPEEHESVIKRDTLSGVIAERIGEMESLEQTAGNALGCVAVIQDLSKVTPVIRTLIALLVVAELGNGDFLRNGRVREFTALAGADDLSVVVEARQAFHSRGGILHSCLRLRDCNEDCFGDCRVRVPDVTLYRLLGLPVDPLWQRGALIRRWFRR